MTKPKLILCVGLQRSGNHAILGWVEALFPGTVFHNDQFHDLFADESALRARLAEHPAPCTIVSFEDSANRTHAPDRLLLDSIAPLPAAVADAYDVHRLVILRDPYNTWASRVAANARTAEFGRPLTSNPSWDLYRENWLRLAALDADPDWQVILFNRWKDDTGYRRAICDALGGTYGEEALDQVSHRGGGSSFEGVPRPSYLGMLRQFPKYLSGPFLRRLTANPAYYVKRFIAPPAKGSTMQVDKRWTTLIGKPESAALLADPDLRAVTARLFGAKALPPEPEMAPDTGTGSGSAAA
ncbi:MAG: hypothetical protein KDA50_00685 [Rhodobacteraceae bacterium]|nr:hypothetical protein [Paracoccaceae bacterium]